MPAYDYRCTVCDTTFEVVRSISDSGVVTCPECNGATKRVFTPVGVHFKGSGFYNTDSRSAPAPTPASVGKSKEPAAAAADSCSASGTTGCAGCPAKE
jgi:putative FmdB family regulatory protein